MSIKIGSAAKNVVDVVFGTSSSSKNVDVVKDWNGNIIWERTHVIVMDQDNTTITIDPTKFEQWWERGSFTPTWGPHIPTVQSVTVNGTPLSYGTDYVCEYSGYIGEACGEFRGRVTVYGKGNYTGSAYVEYDINIRQPLTVYIWISSVDFYYMNHVSSDPYLTWTGDVRKQYIGKADTETCKIISMSAQTRQETSGTATLRKNDSFVARGNILYDGSVLFSGLDLEVKNGDRLKIELD